MPVLPAGSPSAAEENDTVRLNELTLTLRTKHHDVEMSLRGLLRGFGLKVGPTTSRSFAARIGELVEGRAVLTAVADALLAARETLAAQRRGLEKRLRDQARHEKRARLLMSVPGVGVIVALTFAAARSEEHTSELQSRQYLVCRLLLEKKKTTTSRAR